MSGARDDIFSNCRDFFVPKFANFVCSELSKLFDNAFYSIGSGSKASLYNWECFEEARKIIIFGLVTYDHFCFVC